MKRYNILLITLLTITMLLLGCGTSTTLNNKTDDSKTNIKENKEKAINPKDRLEDVYNAALDSFMNLDQGLNSDMKYIAIDTKSLKGINEENKKAIIEHFKKYNVEVMDASIDDLKEKGLFNKETLSLQGILLSVSKFEKKSDAKIIIEGSKYRSGLGAIGVKCTVVYKDGLWKVESSDIRWIS